MASLRRDSDMTQAFIDASEKTAELDPIVSPRRLYRIAGWGGIGAFVAWAAQPVLVAVSSATMGDGYQDWQALVGGRTWAGTVESAVFMGIGVGMLFFVTATISLVRRAGGLRSTASRVGATFGVAGAVGWIFTAGSTLSQYTSVSAGIPEVAPDRDLQIALMQTLALVMTGFLLATAFGMAGFGVFLATSARRAGVIGWPLTCVAILFLLIFGSMFAIPLSPPWGAVGFVLQSLIVGIAFLVKSRKA